MNRRGRLPEQVDEQLATWLVRQMQTARAAEWIYDQVDSDTAKVIRQSIETIMSNANKTQDELVNDTKLYRKLMKELRDLRESKDNGQRGD